MTAFRGRERESPDSTVTERGTSGEWGVGGFAVVDADLDIDIADSEPGTVGEHDEDTSQQVLATAEPLPKSPADSQPPVAAPGAMEEMALPDDSVDASASPPTPRSAQRRWTFLLAGLVLLVIAAVVMIGAREAVMRLVPASTQLYRSFGLLSEVPGAGLDLRDVESQREWAGETDILVVSGTVANVDDEPRGVPPLRIILHNRDDEEIQAITLVPEKSLLVPGEVLRFEARIGNPPATARRIRVSFVANRS
jgi:hypothetical protein